MGQSVMLKRKEKAFAIFDELGKDCSFESFYEKFIEKNPKDFERIRAKYNKEERKTKEGKGHPMPHPTQYIRNLFNIYKKEYMK